MSNTTPPAPSHPSEQQPDPQGDYSQGGPQQGLPDVQPEPKFNVLAIISLVTAFVISLAAIITGHIALSQIKKTGEKGRGLALAGVILGYLGLIAGAITIVVMIIAGMSAGAAAIDAAESQQGAIATQEASTDAEGEPVEEAPAATVPADGPVSPEVCAAFAESETAIQSATTDEQRGLVGMELLKQLGDAPGPNQATYSAAYTDLNELYLTNPEANELPESMLAAQDQIMADAAACGSQLGQ